MKSRSKKTISKKQTKKELIKAKTLFDHLKSITEREESNYWDTLSEEDKKTFAPYMVNRFLSMNKDWVEIIDELQKFTIGLLSKKDVFRLYFDIFPKGRVFLQYVKATSPMSIPERLAHLFMTYYECGMHTAREYFALLMRTSEGKNEINTLLDLYGLDDKEKKQIRKEVGL